VLLIEDDPAVREGLELALTRTVHRGLAAVSGQAGGGLRHDDRTHRLVEAERADHPGGPGPAQGAGACGAPCPPAGHHRRVFADGVIEFIQALGLTKVDLLGWTLGGTVAQHITRRRPDLVRKLIVAAADPGGTVPGAPSPNEKVRATMAKPEVTAYDLVHLLTS
jgi:pimeloyl-ACP methyl ester carboxylesterase